MTITGFQQNFSLNIVILLKKHRCWYFTNHTEIINFTSKTVINVEDTYALQGYNTMASFLTYNKANKMLRNMIWSSRHHTM